MGGDDLESCASPGSGEDHELLGCDGSSPESDEQLSLPKWVHTEREGLVRRYFGLLCRVTNEAWEHRLTSKILYMIWASMFALATFLLGKNFDSMFSGSRNQSDQAPVSPFGGAFARFPGVNDLPSRQRRITLVGVWEDDYFAPYLRHFYYTVQKNADSVDLLLINRLKTPGKSCMDFDGAGVNITWGNNIKVVCMSDEEYIRRHVDFMCSRTFGWGCNATEHAEVTAEWSNREDYRNYEWRPFLGYMMKDLFQSPQNPFWAWVDQDQLLGNFARYPFNLLSQLSLVTGRERMPDALFMAGQLTAFNFDDQALGSAWKRFPGLKTPAHFTRYLDGKFPNSPEERYWSEGYLQSGDDLPGSELSWAIYPDLHGDDYLDGKWGTRNATQTHVMSGREVLQLDRTFTREQIEQLILTERHSPVDNFGGVGWTGGVDGSAYLINQSGLNPEEAKALAVKDAQTNGSNMAIHTGIVDVQVISTNCTVEPKFVTQCIDLHPLTRSEPPIYRQSVVRLKEQPPMHVLRRLELDDRPRGYERKLLVHHLFTLSRGNKWFELPPFDIADDLVLMCNNDAVQVFRMGDNRDQTLFYRAEDEDKIG
ncbi:hypothetical protein Z517_06700 [Fonsecaea pedrosoi CBS 271.37]|uniref:Uncharacterized protein n=1 Tax=Fonsecaea pedrosoi CBS 271.37 TaxID=1442368 RepID=A0A0D2GNG5_9EURO|nr:uncharacterized protein Z517_06700 [Fonsecaea pedrosoi CBS 271.37]KIW80085.1 hypothetical protein Z517_06700 [Fonsecaea pedrosoi CBS 271.37]